MSRGDYDKETSLIGFKLSFDAVEVQLRRLVLRGEREPAPAACNSPCELARVWPRGNDADY